MNPSHFIDAASILAHSQEKKKGHLLITYQQCEGYPGMVLGIVMRFDTLVSLYELDLEWMSFGLDFYGDTLQESYVYCFPNLEGMIGYLESKYSIRPSDIPKEFRINPHQYPNPLDGKDPAEYEAGWQQFQQDFQKGLFLDPSLSLSYSSIG
jgi:hypothetical protein